MNTPRPARPRTASPLVAQITTRLGDTILDVRELGRARPEGARALRWCAAGLGLFLGGAGLFAAEQSLDWEGHRAALRRAQEAEGRLPDAPGWGLGGVGLALALAGLVPLGIGLRRRADRAPQEFTVGEGRGVSLHVPGEGLPRRDAFTLVRAGGGLIDVNIGTCLKGHVNREGRRFDLAALADRDGAGAVPLREGDRCVLTHGELTFEIEAEAPTPLAVGRPGLDRPLWWSTAAAAIVVLGSIAAAVALQPEVPAWDDEDGDLAAVSPALSERMIAVMTGPIPVVIDEEAPPPEALTEDEAGGVGQRHRGEEGTMGRPSARSKSGLYATRGPRGVAPRMARRFDPELASRQAGLLGTMQQQGGHFLASPTGGAFAVGSDGGEVWGGLGGAAVGSAHGVGGLGLVGGAREAAGNDRYGQIRERTFTAVVDAPLSTFAIDVDTAAYANVRRFLQHGDVPPPSAVRVEEMINYFDYADPAPQGGEPLAIHAEVADAPWSPHNRLVRVAVKARELDRAQLPPQNLVFLIDTSGSMNGADRLDLVKAGMRRLADALRPEDRVAIVTYAGASGLALPSTPGANKGAIQGVLAHLRPSGGTHGAAGIWLAYRVARESFLKGGINRIILATDGDFNVGVSSHGELLDIIERERRTGVFLSVLGVGRGNLNDHTMEQLADRGNGNYAYLDSAAEAERVLVHNAAGTLATMAKDVKIQVEFNPREVASYRLIGYENRDLADRDFADDSKDGGEAGAGHTVTALYEVVPAAAAASRAGGPALRYQRARDLSAAASSGELLTVKVRYKEPDGDKSRLLERPVIDEGHDAGQSSDAFRLAAAVAAFGMILQGSEQVGAWELDDVAGLLERVDLADPRGELAELRDLVRRAARIRGRVAMR